MRMIKWSALLGLLVPMAYAQPVGNVPYSAFPNCADTGGQHLNINSTTGAISCGTTSGSPTGSASGDLSGTYPGPTVAKINGIALGSTTATAGNTLLGSGTQWVSHAFSGDFTVSSSGVATLATVNSNVGSFGDGTHVGAFTVNAKGLITAASSVTITGAAPTGTAGGDLSGSYPNPTVAKVDGVAYPATPSTNTVPVVTGSNTITYEAVPNAALANSSMTLAGHSVSLGGTQTFACADLSNGATGCSTATGTSGATIPLLNGANTWSGVQSVNSGDLALKGATSGTITLNAAATAGSNTITLPAGTTDFSSTGGTSQVIKQTGAGSAFTVARLACSDLSNGATGCSTATGTSGATIPLLNAANTWSASQAASITTLAISTATFTPDASNNHYKIVLVHASCPCTLANPSSSFVAGTSGVIEVQQSATGSDTIGTWGSSYEAPGGTATITLSTGANAVDVLSYFVIDSTHILLVPSLNFSH